MFDAEAVAENGAERDSKPTHFLASFPDIVLPKAIRLRRSATLPTRSAADSVFDSET